MKPNIKKKLYGMTLNIICLKLELSVICYGPSSERNLKFWTNSDPADSPWKQLETIRNIVLITEMFKVVVECIQNLFFLNLNVFSIV